MSDHRLTTSQNATLCDALDRILSQGAVLRGDLVISVAEVDLVYVALSALLASADKAFELGVPPQEDALSIDGSGAASASRRTPMSTPQSARSVDAADPAHLAQLMANRDRLEREIGTSDPEAIVRLISTLEARAAKPASSNDSLVEQLNAIYQEREQWGDPRELKIAVDNLTEQLRGFYDVGERVGDTQEMKRQLESFEAQLDALYTEREQQGDPNRTIASLTEQLESIYEQQEKAGDPSETITSLTEQLESIYAEREKDGDPAETIASLTEQLESIYEEREATGDVTELQGTIDSLTEQLESIYEERENDGDLNQTVESLNEQLQSLYAEREQHGSQEALAEMVVSMEAQLQALYAERDGDDDANEIDALRQTVESFEAQLDTLYREREHQGDANTTIESLTEQLHALYAERESAGTTPALRTTWATPQDDRVKNQPPMGNQTLGSMLEQERQTMLQATQSLHKEVRDLTQALARGLEHSMAQQDQLKDTIRALAERIDSAEGRRGPRGRGRTLGSALSSLPSSLFGTAS